MTDFACQVGSWHFCPAGSWGATGHGGVGCGWSSGCPGTNTVRTVPALWAVWNFKKKGGKDAILFLKRIPQVLHHQNVLTFWKETFSEFLFQRKTESYPLHEIFCTLYPISYGIEMLSFSQVSWFGNSFLSFSAGIFKICTLHKLTLEIYQPDRWTCLVTGVWNTWVKLVLFCFKTNPETNRILPLPKSCK